MKVASNNRVRALTQLLPPKLVAAAVRLKHGGALDLGRGSYVHRRVQIIGRMNVVIGANSCISEGCWLNVNQRTIGSIGIRIGSNCFIGRDNFLSSGKVIEIGDYCLTTLGCRFICSTHVTENPRLPYICSGTTADESIAVGVNCFFGAGATVIGNVSIGHGSVIGAGALVRADVPPFSLVVGTPGRVIRRFSFSRGAWIEVDRLDPSDLIENPNASAYLLILQSAVPRVSLPWLAAGMDFGSL